LLTGASGFLGRFLTLELLRQLPPEGRLIAVVRGRTDEHAAQRLASAFGEPSEMASELRTALANKRLIVASGDLAKPRIGLDERAWERWASDVDAIVHNGAWVNHVLPYSSLFDANVLGTVEVARLALHGCRKTVSFVSSIAVGQALQGPRLVREAADVASWFESFPADTVYAGGYAATKWAGEVVLGRLAERVGCPLAIFRCGLIMPHSQLVGAINDDLLSRLLGSIALTRAAPRSFYCAGASRAPFQGLPVDFVARGIAALTLRAFEGTHVFHVVDRPETGVTLDELVERLTERRKCIVRFADHEHWFAEFERRLSELPRDVRARTAHPLLAYWREPFGMRADVRFDPSRFAAALASVGGAATLPVLGSAYIRKLIDDSILHMQAREAA
jgi:fatty acid CoA ligase FadD9